MPIKSKPIHTLIIFEALLHNFSIIIYLLLSLNFTTLHY